MSDGYHGYYEIETGRIAIDTSLSANGKVKTRCHELAHALIRRERQDGDPELDRASEELVVESVAFTCVGALGIKTDGYSVPYVTSWAEQSDLSVLEQTAALIDRLASRIEDAVLEAPPRAVQGRRIRGAVGPTRPQGRGAGQPPECLSRPAPTPCRWRRASGSAVKRRHPRLTRDWR
jgi:hypothetical protein